MKDKYSNPPTGIGVMIFKDGKVLMTRRKGSHGEGEYAFPGGHLEHGESFEECGKRETREESGIEIKNVKFQFLANVTKYNPKHYVHIGLTADLASGTPRITEPDKTGPWKWYDIDHLPKPLFEMCKLAFKSLKTGEIYFDS